MIYEKFLEKFTDWRPETLYWSRFSIAERFGKGEIESVYDEVFKEAKSDHVLLTELVMILNHKSWQHCNDLEKSRFCDYYAELYYKTYDYAIHHLTGEQMTYFLNIID